MRCRKDEGDRPVYPEQFIDHIRQALIADLTVEQIAILLALAADMYELMDLFSGECILDRCKGLANAIKVQQDFSKFG